MPITLHLTPTNGQDGVFAENRQAARREAIDFVERTSGQTLAACYQCAKCAAGCPLAAAMDLAPQQIIRALQLGQPDLALHSQTLWLCVGCQTCATRCPCNVELPRIMDALRLWAEVHGPQPTPRDIPTFHHVFLKSVELTGRAYEIGLIGGYNPLSLHLPSRFPLAPPQPTQSKTQPPPHPAEARPENTPTTSPPRPCRLLPCPTRLTGQRGVVH